MSEWKPIETAPNELVVVGGYFEREGKVVWREDVVNPFVNVCVKDSLFYRRQEYEVMNVYINSSFTHWRPYPEPPEVTK